VGGTQRQVHHRTHQLPHTTFIRYILDTNIWCPPSGYNYIGQRHALQPCRSACTCQSPVSLGVVWLHVLCLVYRGRLVWDRLPFDMIQ
jgi:hypothetical protein